LVSGSIDKGVKVWDAATGQQLATLDTNVGALWLAHHPRRSQVAYFTVLNGIQLWNYDPHEEGMTAAAVDGPAVARFSPDGQRIVASIARAGLWVNDVRRTATNQGSRILVLDAASGTDVLEIGEDLHSASWSADGRHIVAASDPQREIRMHSASTGEQTRVFEADTSHSAGFALSGRGLDLVSVDGAIHTWGRRSGDEAEVWTTGSDKRRLDVIGLGMSPHNARVAVVFYSELRAEIWDIRIRSKINSVLVPGPTVGQIVFSNDGNSLYVGSPGGRIVEIDIGSGRETKRFNGHTDSVRAIALSPAEDYLVSGGDSGCIIVWDIASEQPLVTLADAGQSVISLDWSSDGRRIAAGKEDGTVPIWTLPDSP